LERTFDRGIYKHQQAIARLMGLKKAERIKARDAGVITEAEMDDA
jgi:hypothetical protein